MKYDIYKWKNYNKSGYTYSVRDYNGKIICYSNTINRAKEKAIKILNVQGKNREENCEFVDSFVY